MTETKAVIAYSAAQGNLKLHKVPKLFGVVFQGLRANASL
jgi:hypothetical protein